MLSSHLMRDVERCTEYLVVMDRQKIKCSGYIKDLCAGQINRYTVRVNDNVDRAVRIFGDNGVDVIEIHKRDPTVEVQLDGNIKPRDLFAMLIAQDIQIRQLIPRHFTVEEVYRKHVNIGGVHDAGS